MSRPILMPEAKKFSDLFEQYEPWQSRNAPSTDYTKHPWAKCWSEIDYLSMVKKPQVKPSYIGPYCTLRGDNKGHGSLAVHAKPEVYDTIKKGTIFIAHDTIHFEIIQWDDGQALVCAQHSTIIGGCWLAVIDASTIPKEAWRE